MEHNADLVRAQREIDLRNAKAELDPEGVYDLVLRSTGNEDAANDAYCEAVLQESKVHTSTVRTSA